MAVDLKNLPEINFAPHTASEVEAGIISKYEEITGKTLQTADPVRLFLSTLAYVITVQDNMIDMAGKMGLLAYAKGAHLDHLGALMGISRLPASPAMCNLEFAINEALDFEVNIPAGTRVTTKSGDAVFETISQAIITPSTTSCTTPARAVSAGISANGLLPGQICELVDRIPYITSVKNITTTTSGSDIEDDERLRERLRKAPEAFTVAGSRGMYESLTLGASADIDEVVVVSPTPGVVHVAFTLNGGELPDEAHIELVENALSAETVRPLTDQVFVLPPEIVEYQVVGRWYVSSEDLSLISSITQKVASAVEEYRLWQRKKPGRDIEPTKLISLVESAGACRVEIDSPQHIIVPQTSIARETSIALVYAGYDEN